MLLFWFCSKATVSHTYEPNSVNSAGKLLGSSNLYWWGVFRGDLCCGRISGVHVSYQAWVWNNMFDFGCLHVSTLLLIGLPTHRDRWSFSPHRLILLLLNLSLVTLEVQSEPEVQCESVRMWILFGVDSSLFWQLSVLLGVCISNVNLMDFWSSFASSVSFI